MSRSTTPKFTAQNKAVDFLHGNDCSGRTLDLSIVENRIDDIADSCPTEIDEYQLGLKLQTETSDLPTRADVQEYITALDDAENDLMSIETEIEDRLREIENQTEELNIKLKNNAMVQKAVATRLDQARALLASKKNICSACGKDKDR